MRQKLKHLRCFLNLCSIYSTLRFVVSYYHDNQIESTYLFHKIWWRDNNDKYQLICHAKKCTAFFLPDGIITCHHPEVTPGLVFSFWKMILIPLESPFYVHMCFNSVSTVNIHKWFDPHKKLPSQWTKNAKDKILSEVDSLL